MAPPIGPPPDTWTTFAVSIEATHRDLAVRGTVPQDVSGRLLGIHGDVVHCAEFRGGRLLTYAVHRVRGEAHADVAAGSILLFGGSILAFAPGSVAHELSSTLEFSTPVDLAGRSRRLAAFPKRDHITGDLHLLAVAPDRSQAHVVVSSGALTRRVRPIVDPPSRVADLAIAGDLVLFASDGFLGVGSSDLDGPVTWIPTGVAAPALVHADVVDATVVAFTLTPLLERWTIHPGSSTIDREVIDPTPQRLARTNHHERDAGRQLLWTIGDRSTDTHDLATGRAAHRSFGRRRSGDFVFVADPQRPRAADGGWLVGFVHGSRRAAELIVLDAGDIAGSVIAAIRVPQLIPVDLHTTWIPATSQEPPQGDTP